MHILYERSPFEVTYCIIPTIWYFERENYGNSKKFNSCKSIEGGTDE